MNQVQNPAGSRDCMPGEVRRKRSIRHIIERVFANSGCRPIRTPAFYFQST